MSQRGLATRRRHGGRLGNPPLRLADHDTDLPRRRRRATPRRPDPPPSTTGRPRVAGTGPGDAAGIVRADIAEMPRASRPKASWPRKRGWTYHVYRAIAARHAAATRSCPCVAATLAQRSRHWGARRTTRAVAGSWRDSAHSANSIGTGSPERTAASREVSRPWRTKYHPSPNGTPTALAASMNAF